MDRSRRLDVYHDDIPSTSLVPSASRSRTPVAERPPTVDPTRHGNGMYSV